MTEATSSELGLLSSPVRRGLVDALAREEDGLTAAQLAGDLELHVTTVRFHLDQLVAAGLVRAEFSRAFGVGRPRKVYFVAQGSIDDVAADAAVNLLTGLLVNSFGDRSLTPAEAGQRWAKANVPNTGAAPATSPGQWLAKMGQMVDVLQVWGYTPDLSTSEGGRSTSINLVDCPFLPLAKDNPAVVCGIHRGLLSGAMEQLGEHDAEVSLEPFVRPDLCQAHLRTRTPFAQVQQPGPTTATHEEPPDES